ncbi:MAG: DEAD/DEAH box helicase [Chloroflexi bacterium]|nr:DEAD/DEAH box helicase [Chloroflexota bacterium]
MNERTPEPGGFAGLGLSRAMLSTLEGVGYHVPSPVQTEAIPPLLAGVDAVVQAQTGTGKTAAFAIPVVERLDDERLGPQAVVLAPTRELAMQVAAEIRRLGRHAGVRVLAVYGGQSYEVQLRALRRGVDVVVATPGRLKDHIRGQKVDLSRVRTIVLDEADEMLNMGFLEDVEFILGQLPPKRQTALFSATMPPQIASLAERFMSSAQTIRLTHRKSLTVPSTEHLYYLVPFKHKFDALVRLLRFKQPQRALIFAATKHMVNELVPALQDRGFDAELIHSDLNQAQRDRVMGAFRAGGLPILVATDVAARGLDVDNVSHVFNFDMPQDVEYYVHRIGRTGRIGRRGEAVSLVNHWEERQIKVLERATGARIVKDELPSQSELADSQLALLAGNLHARLSEGSLARYQALAKELSSAGHDPLEVAAAALALAAGPHDEALLHTELPAEVSAGAVASRRFDRQRGVPEKRTWKRFPGDRRIRPSGLWKST